MLRFYFISHSYSTPSIVASVIKPVDRYTTRNDTQLTVWVFPRSRDTWRYFCDRVVKTTSLYCTSTLLNGHAVEMSDAINYVCRC